MEIRHTRLGVSYQPHDMEPLSSTLTHFKGMDDWPTLQVSISFGINCPSSLSYHPQYTMSTVYYAHMRSLCWISFSCMHLCPGMWHTVKLETWSFFLIDYFLGLWVYHYIWQGGQIYMEYEYNDVLSSFFRLRTLSTLCLFNSCCIQLREFGFLHSFIMLKALQHILWREI